MMLCLGTVLNTVVNSFELKPSLECSFICLTILNNDALGLNRLVAKNNFVPIILGHGY